MDEVHVAARRALLDALVALGPHAEAVIVVGAQALYLRTGEGDLAVAPYTTDGDLALDPELLGEIPPLEQALDGAGFVWAGGDRVGVWLGRSPTPTQPDLSVQIDLLVPQTLVPGKGRRAARLAGHLPTAARIVRGLEGVVVDNDPVRIGALELADPRTVLARVAGPAALLVAKLHKIDDRVGTTRAGDKDALDVFRLLRSVATEELAGRAAQVLGDARSRDAGHQGLELLETYFHRGGEGSTMASRALAGLMDEDEVRISCEVLAQELLVAVRNR